MIAKFIYDVLNESTLISKYKKGMIINVRNNTLIIKKVEDHNNDFDLVYVYDTKAKKDKIYASTWIDENGTIKKIEKIRKQREKQEPSMTKRQYERLLKDARAGIQETVPDIEDDYSYIYDSAESMIYDETLYNYLYKKYIRDYNSRPSRRDLIELLANDMSY